MTCLVQPIARITEISLHCSKRFPVIELLKLKKQMNIVIAITMLKITSKVFSAYTRKLESIKKAYLVSIIK